MFRLQFSRSLAAVTLAGALLLSGCASKAGQAGEQTHPQPQSQTVPAATPDQSPTAPAPAPSQPTLPVQRVAAGYLTKEGDLLRVPPTTTLYAVAQEGLRVDFYARPTTSSSMATHIGRANASGGHYSLTWEVPSGAGPDLVVWAVATQSQDEPGPQGAIPQGTPTVRVAPVPVGDRLTDAAGFPLYPAFNWHTNLSTAEQQELAGWLGASWNVGVKTIFVGGRIQDISSQEVLDWTRKKAEEAGWKNVVPSGGGSSWGFEATRGSVRVGVNFALGFGGGPPLHPELGYGMVVRVVSP